MAGYIFSGYTVLLFLLSRFEHFLFKTELMPLEGFDINFSDLPLQMKLPLYLVDIVSIIAVIIFISGIVLAVYYKKRNNK